MKNISQLIEKYIFSFFLCLPRLSIVTILLILILFINGCSTSKFGNSPEQLSLAKLIKNGKIAYNNDSYIKATQCYIDAVLEAEEIAPTHVKDIKFDLANIYIEWARELYWQAKRERSIKICQKAIIMLERASKIDSTYSIRCQILLKKLRRELKFINSQMGIDDNSYLANLKLRSMKIDLLSQQGDLFLKHKQYVNARDKYEELMMLDPFNLNVIRAFKNLDKEVKELATKPKVLTKEERIAEVERSYVQTILKKEAQKKALENSK